jgi:hypothetical protein
MHSNNFLLKNFSFSTIKMKVSSSMARELQGESFFHHITVFLQAQTAYTSLYPFKGNKVHSYIIYPLQKT